MKFLIIIPAFNEEKFISTTLESLSFQTYKNFKLVIVNDGSLDKTQEIAESFHSHFLEFEIIKNNINTNNFHEPGEKIIRAFYLGLSKQIIDKFDIICKFDADLIFPVNYLEVINQEYIYNSQLGICGGHIYVNKNKKWIYEKISNYTHLRGNIKSYRKKCFIEIGGLKKTIGWDNLDEFLAIKNNWNIKTIPSLKVKLLKETGFSYKNKQVEILGHYFYHLGIDFIMVMISCLKAAYFYKSLRIISISFLVYLLQVIKKTPRTISSEEIQFIRKYKWKKFFNKFLFKKLKFNLSFIKFNTFNH